jgi:hypothetical protein
MGLWEFIDWLVRMLIVPLMALLAAVITLLAGAYGAIRSRLLSISFSGESTMEATANANEVHERRRSVTRIKVWVAKKFSQALPPDLKPFAAEAAQTLRDSQKHRRTRAWRYRLRNVIDLIGTRWILFWRRARRRYPRK